MFKRTAVFRGVMLAISALAAQQAWAQDATQRIEITGSNIRRLDAETPSPVQVISADDLKKSGYTTVSQVLQNITANGQGTLSNAFPGAFAGSATGVSLRGLTTAATLVLIDGHRMAPFPLSDDGQRSFVDISSIPFDAVDHIEILKDGASAAYGSDAMAGVVNIILKKHYAGTTVSVEAGSTTEGGGDTVHAALMHGFGELESDGYTAYINLEYRRQKEILQSQRRGDGLWASLDQTSIGGISQVPGVISPIRPKPPTLGTVYLNSPGTFSTATTYFYPAPIAPNPAYTGTCTFTLLQSGGCSFINPHAEIQPKTENFNVIGSFAKRLGTDWTLDVKASLFESKGEQYNAGVSANGMTVFPQNFNPLVAVAAGVLPHLVGNTISSVTVPANYPGNPLGVPAQIRGVSLDAPIAHDDFDSKSYRLVASLSGTIADWDARSALGYTEVQTKKEAYGATNTPALFAALNRASNPFLITGGNTAADIAAIYPVASATDTSKLSFAEFSATRTLMQLTGGDLGFSAGASFIHRSLDAPAPDLVAQGIVSGNNAYVKGSQTVSSAYAEISAPVLKSLELDGHVRYDHFDNAGNSTTPSVGFKFTPVQEFGFRGTYGKGFRAPNAAENGQAGQAYSAGTGADPILCPGGNTNGAGNVISQCNFNVIYLNAANPALKSEKSTSTTFGFLLEPVKGWTSTIDFFQVEIKNQIVAGTGDINNAVRGGPLTETCADGHGGTVTCTTSVGEIIYIPVEFVNANSTKVSGVELSTRYKFKLGDMGSLTTDFNWSHTMSYLFTTGGVAYQLAGTHGPAVIGGNTGNPKDRAQATFTWEKGPWQVATTFNWVSAFDLTDPSGSNAGVPVLNCADGAQQGGYYAAWFQTGTQPSDSKYCKVQSFLDTDVTFKYEYDKHWTLHGAVTNLFNRQPPLDLNTYGGGNLPYNPSMHQVGAVGRFISIGANYKF